MPCLGILRTDQVDQELGVGPSDPGPRDSIIQYNLSSLQDQRKGKMDLLPTNY